MTRSTLNQAIEILQLSNDGNALTATELGIVELAVNARLNEDGKAYLAELLRRLQSSARRTR